ncbi:E3 ubiquitin-protein ligase lubel isoform X3 [Toxorhynchites rutilus septentrionalis]|nr:E3 ubiquitin-protein ligase lubel isoform X3 [Toxorhynchites rutilus septentrionalis]XP_055643482.1 E3 ubiquitin-protein ligase lubel isoform X3 [Toxorhynchites rutilus septentrionalis]XP_055643483.1 E3 ubiquitin-protein ligase lubel isoform X3 [Toxorhynchites rutilus septentrionalis]
MANNPAAKFKPTRTMPAWVTKSSDRVGPPPPLPPANADPEYEVIDIANQQYSNTPPPIPVKSPDIKRITVMKCDLCGSVMPAVRCEQCDQNLFCASCDDRYHRHPKRQTHTRTPVELQTTTVKPPLPPKGEGSSSGPLAPPRRNKRPGSFHFPSPMLGRKQDQDQIIPTTVPQGPINMQQQKPPQPPPSPALSLREKMNSLKRFIHPSNRPLPDPPEQKIHSSNSSLDSIAKRSPAGGKSMSSTMEKIQNNTAATLDRMTLLQQRYRQHQEAMKDEDRSRRASLTSNVDLQSSMSIIRTKPPLVPSTLHHQQQQFHLHHQQQQQQQHAMQSGWMEPPSPRIRSGSVASGINLMPDVSAVSNHNNPSSNNPPFMSSTQRPEFGTGAETNFPNPRSTSVFNLNQMHQQPQPNPWGFNPIHQAHSMAHMAQFNQLQWNQMNPWAAAQSQNGSNMSLNMPSSQQGQSGYPPNWNSAWGGMYPYPMGMMPMMPGMAMPPPRSRAHSRSRAGSPALSIKSRKSTMSMRNLNRNSFVDDLTDDEDSDNEFMKTRNRRDWRSQVDSDSSRDLNEPEPNTFIRPTNTKHSRFNRDRRAASSARSLIDYPTSSKRDSHRSKYDREELIRDRLDKMSLSSPRKNTSDSMPVDSELSRRRYSKPGINGKHSSSSPRKINSDSLTNDSDIDFEKRRLAKQKISSNLSSPRKITSDSFTNDSDTNENERRNQKKPKAAGVTSTTPRRMESNSVTEDSDVVRERTKTTAKNQQAEVEKTKTGKSKFVRPIPKKIPSDSHTPDSEGEQKRRFTNKKIIKRNSSTEFIPNDSDVELEQRKEENRRDSGVTKENSTVAQRRSNNETIQPQTIELKNHINESKLEATEFLADDDSPTAPISIEAPDREWECEFCTFVNEAGVKVCAICCKTVTPAVITTKATPETPRSPPPDVVQEPPSLEKKPIPNSATEVKKLQAVTPPPVKDAETKKKDNDDELENVDDGDFVEVSYRVDENDVEESQYENHEIRGHHTQIKPECQKESSEISQNLNSEMTKVVNKIVKEKVSTGCGPSPPREVSTQKEQPKLLNRTQPSPSGISIGTSPPPQDMSTQTCDVAEKTHENVTEDQSFTQDKPNNDLTRPHSSSIYQRSHSLATPQLLQVGNSHPDSHQSFISDTQSLPSTPHETSPLPQVTNIAQNNDRHDLPHHHDENLSYLDRAIHQIIQTAAKATFSPSRPLDQNKYRAMTDLSHIDTMQPTLIKDLAHKRQMTADKMSEYSEAAAKLMESLKISDHNNMASEELIKLLKEAEYYKFSPEELHAAIAHCKDKHPVQWLRDHWSKLIETVQTLATKYGHEKRENTIGTISSIEAREALRLHKGNIWHAITECIEQRQKKYNEIASKGNFTREDIVTSLTAHHGNLELAVVELSKTQLRPFLMRIWGPPNGADNDSSNLLLQQALEEDRSGISTEIQEFISAHVEKELLANNSTCETEVSSPPERPETSSPSAVEEEAYDPMGDTANLSNTTILRDIEKLIDQMEINQANQNDEVLKNVQSLLAKLIERSESRPASQASVRSESCERIIVKSPIPLPRSSQSSVDETKPIYEDIRVFMAENIQEILPSLVSQVQQELESVPIRTPKSLHGDARETMMNAESLTDDYQTISNFPLVKNFETVDDFPSMKRTSSMGFKTAQEEENEYANIQDFLRRAVRAERLTDEFERYKTQHYIFDSSSDEARMTGESTDYYDIVAVNQRLQDLLEHQRIDRRSEEQSIHSGSTPAGSLPISTENLLEEAIYVNTADMAAMNAEVQAVEPNDSRQIKKRRIGRVPVNKNSYLQRRPGKSSSESDLDVVVQNSTAPVTVLHIDHTKELKQVIDTIEKIENELQTEANDLERKDVESDQPVYDNVTITQTSTTETTIVEKPLVLREVEQPISEGPAGDTREKVFEHKAFESPTPEMDPPNADPNTNSSILTNQIVNEDSTELAYNDSTNNEAQDQNNVPPNSGFIESQQITSSNPQPIQSPPKSPVEDIQVSPIQEVPSTVEIVISPQTTPQSTNDEPTTLSVPKPSHNLSDIVLDTKRLIQQMKDEIASDMATMEDEEEVYDNEYYEEDEYEDWSEGDENGEEWDSNEEYDVDENGDYFEYEDEDDDGSVMFSEIAPEDIEHPEIQTPERMEEISNESKPELPQINAALVREMERNSASEVSDLPLDSDFNDTLSVIEQSMSEVEDILSLAVNSLASNNRAEYDDTSSAETLQNSPETSEISEATLVADVNDVTEPTLVAEENLNLTMRNVQSLLNAKTLIGELIKTAQRAEGMVTEQATVENMISNDDNRVRYIDGAIQAMSTTIIANEPSVAIDTKDTKILSEQEEQSHDLKNTVENIPNNIALLAAPLDQSSNVTHTLDATIEMLNFVARDLNEPLHQVPPMSSVEVPRLSSQMPPEELAAMPSVEETTLEPRIPSPITSKEVATNDNSAKTQQVNEEVPAQPVVPQYATINKNTSSGGLEIQNVVQRENEEPAYVNISEMKALLLESGKIDNMQERLTDSTQNAVIVQNMTHHTSTSVISSSISSNRDHTLIHHRNEDQNAGSGPSIDISIEQSHADSENEGSETNSKISVNNSEAAETMGIIDSIIEKTDKQTPPDAQPESESIVNRDNINETMMDEKVSILANVFSQQNPNNTEVKSGNLADKQATVAAEDGHTLIPGQESGRPDNDVEQKMLPMSDDHNVHLAKNGTIEQHISSTAIGAETENIRTVIPEQEVDRLDTRLETEIVPMNDVHNVQLAENGTIEQQSSTRLFESFTQTQSEKLPTVAIETETLGTQQTVNGPVETNPMNEIRTSSSEQNVFEKDTTHTTDISSTEQSVDQDEQMDRITNGELHQNHHHSFATRESSEEPSSYIEVQASQVVIHAPSALPLKLSTIDSHQSANIYENVDIIPITEQISANTPPAKSHSNTSQQSDKKGNKQISTSSIPTSTSIQKTTKTTKPKPKTSTDIKKKPSTASDSSSRRNSLRKNSIGTPFGPVLTNTVKNMQKEFLNKAQKEPLKSITNNASTSKPSKLVQPKAFTNKLTKTIAPTQPNHMKGASKASSSSIEPGSSNSTPGPSSSKGTPIGSREGSVTSEQRRKLRKKYMETCFSDDYISSDEDEDITTITESESRTIIRSLVKPFEPSEEPLEIQAQRLLDEGLVHTYQQAELAVQLIEMRYAKDNAIWAATQCYTIEEAKDLLQKECELCLGIYPMNEIISMLKCTHTCCLDCAKVYYTEEIMHRSITNCNCPYCKEPDLNNPNVTEDDVLEYFSNLDILLKNIVDEEVHDLFQRKLRDRTLMQDPNFKWCVDCSSGFFARPRQKRLICPDCGSITCSACRKPWEPQHEGISCEKFAAWKEANDPELQAQGVARHLQAHGISCPNCNFKYSLSRGGCMHFTCIQCKFEFCFGCNKPFMMGAKCDVSPYCAKLGLHAHHPRNCLFYLRDKDPRDLQSLLTMHNVTFDTEPSELLKREFAESQSASMKCPIPLQKETPAGLMDTICNGDVPDDHAGLCRTHYVEYLVGAVSKAQIDPLPILDLTDCVQELRRRGMPLPERGPWDTDEIYREMCQKIVKEQIPLN